MDEWKKDYLSMLEHFIYEKQSISFEELIERMRILTARIRQYASEAPR